MEMNAEGAGEMSEEKSQIGEEMLKGEEETTKAVSKSPFGGKRHPGGRKKGQVNRVTKDVKEAVLKAFDKAGGHKYLLKLANGTASDRAAFMNLVGKVMPKEVNGTINHNVIPQLPWLSQRMVDKANPQDAESLGTAGKSLTHQDVVDGEIITPAAGIPMGHPASTDGGHDD